MDTKNKIELTDEQIEQLENEENLELSARPLTDEEMEQLELEESGKKSQLKAGLVGAQDIALLGYGPNLLAAAKTGSFTSPEYVAERDILNRAVKEYAESPETKAAFTTGQIGGGLATAFIPFGAAAKGASLAARAGRAAAVGAALGAVSDVPEIEGKITSPLEIESLKQRATQAAIGGAMGPVAELGVSAISAIKPSSVERGWAALQPRKAFEREARLAAERGKMGSKESIVKFAKEEGIFSGLPTLDDIYERSRDLRKQYGQQLSDLYNRAQDVATDIQHSGLTPKNIKFSIGQKDIEQLKNKAIREFKSENWADPDVRTAITEIESYFSNLGLEDMPDIMQLHKIKSELGDKAYKVGRVESPTNTEKFWRKAERIVDEEIKDRIDAFAEVANKSGDKLLGESLRDFNKKYSLSNKVYEYSADALDSSRAPYDVSGIFRQVALSTPAQVGLSKVGTALEAVPKTLAPKQFAIPLSQIGREDVRMQTAQEMVDAALMQGMPSYIVDQQIQKAPLTPTEKAALRNKVSKGQQ